MHRCLRPLALAAALNVTAGAATAAAQTVMIRNGPPNTKAEVLLNGATVGTGTTNEAGEVTIPLTTGAIGAAGIDANIYLDVCDTVRRVQIVDRTKIVPAAAENCDRREISGIFWVRTVNTIVFDLGGAAPSLLLVRGTYVYKAPRDEEAPHIWRPLPTGLLVYGGSGNAKLDSLFSQACGDATPCSGTNTGLGGYTFGATYWIRRWIGAEASYVKPRQIKATGGDTFSFTSTQDTDIFTVAAKGGVPAGPVRIFGQGGLAYHTGTWKTHETIDVQSQDFEYKTHGWSYVWGAGAEVWVWKKIAIYADLGVIKVRGNANTGGEARIDDTVRYLFTGAKFSLTPK
jgi:opacity protein-like surface antigen